MKVIDLKKIGLEKAGLKNNTKNTPRGKRRLLRFIVPPLVFCLGCFAVKEFPVGQTTAEGAFRSPVTAARPQSSVAAALPVTDASANPADLFLPTAATVGRLKSLADIKRHLYYIDETAYADETLLNIETLMAYDLKTDLSDIKKPKVLILHTHSQETFADSAPGQEADSIVGVGSVLADILAKEYGIGVVHDFGRYDVVDGETARGASYERMEPAARAILAKYPSIEIIVDLHRDGVPEDVHLITETDGKPTARLMFFNGVSCESDGEGGGRPLSELPNPYQRENLAMSLRAQLAANELYPGLARMLYLKPYRYSLHMRPKSLLVEVGANTNTVAEAKNAMRPLAKILYAVIS